MTNATFSQPHYPSRPTQLRLGRIIGVAAVALGILGGGALWLFQTQARPLVAEAVDTTSWPAWLKQAQTYPAPEPPKPVPVPPPPPDDTARRFAALQAKLDEQARALEALAHRPTPPPLPPAKAAPVPHPKKTVAPMLYVAHEPTEASAPATSATYALAPGATKIACVIETQMQSEVSGVLTATVTTGVYDTATGAHLLIPQGATVLGRYDSSQLLHGNTRIPTLSLLLALPNGTSVDLGHAPITDERGVQGLTGEVDQRYWELVRAIVIGGVLKGGAQVAQMGASTLGPAGTVGTGLATEGAQQGHTRLRALDTRPRITVFAGQPCTVILTKELRLPAYYR